MSRDRSRPRGTVTSKSPWPSIMKRFPQRREEPDEFDEDIFSDTRSVSVPEPRRIDAPVELPFDDIMSILRPKKEKDAANAEKEQDTTSSVELDVAPKQKTRVKILGAPTKDQLENKVNDYLSQVETDERLKGLTLLDINYSSTEQEYSALLTFRQE